MARYIIGTRRSTTSWYEVEAISEEDARRLFELGGAEFLDDDYFEETIESIEEDPYTVEEEEEEEHVDITCTCNRCKGRGK